MKSKLVLAGMFSLLLAFGIVTIACDNGSDEDPEKTLVITGITEEKYTQGRGGIQIGILPRNIEEASQDDAVAGAIYSQGQGGNLSGNSAPYTLTVPLYSQESGDRWTGSGAYDVYLLLSSTTGSLTTYVGRNVSFVSATTSVSANDFVEVPNP
jgi:hypothetical protein